MLINKLQTKIEKSTLRNEKAEMNLQEGRLGAVERINSVHIYLKAMSKASWTLLHIETNQLNRTKSKLHNTSSDNLRKVIWKSTEFMFLELIKLPMSILGELAFLLFMIYLTSDPWDSKKPHESSVSLSKE